MTTPTEELARGTWRERLFSTPWRPMRATRTVVPKVPKREALRMPDGSLVMHPEIAAELRKVGAGETAVQGDMLLPANAEVSGERSESAGLPS